MHKVNLLQHFTRDAKQMPCPFVPMNNLKYKRKTSRTSTLSLDFLFILWIARNQKILRM